MAQRESPRAEHLKAAVRAAGGWRGVHVIGVAAVVSALLAPGCGEPQSMLDFAGSTAHAQLSNAEKSTQTRIEIPVDDLLDVDVEIGAPPVALEFSMDAPGRYGLVRLAPAARSEEWTVYVAQADSAVRLALFDDAMNLLALETVRSEGRLRHTMRRPAAFVQLGVASADGSSGGSVVVEVSRTAGVQPTAPRGQAVWLNFDGVRDLAVDRNVTVTFGALDAGDIDPALVGRTEELILAIAETIERNYADFELRVYTSGEEPPAEPMQMIHFGGGHEALLGLAESIDPYNGKRSQNAVVFTDAFAAYASMRLTAEQWGVMIGNVASHELGHLLGLHHVEQAQAVMDVAAGTAWDLAERRDFLPAPLDAGTFPLGQLDAAALLTDTLGPRVSPLVYWDGASAPAGLKSSAARMVEMPAGGSCGTCARHAGW